jgi:hypothetical protein
MTALEHVGRRPVATPDRIGQQTAVEQARAVAEVAAAVQVARQFPRDMDRVMADVEDACSDYELAREAFYQVQNRGQGPSVHLARELARIFGNFQYGVHEMSRDDQANGGEGQSEVQAFAWDVERNTRQSRTFQNPHVRMKDGRRVPLVDVQDIYLSNQNVGARAVREVILTELPKKLVRYAEALCRKTLEAGPEGQSIEQRRKVAIEAFARGNVTEAQLVKRVGRPVGEWTAQDVAELEVLFDSLRRGDTTKDEVFGDAPGQEPVTAKDVAGQTPAPARQQPAEPSGPKATQEQLKKIHALLKDYGVESDDGVRQAIADILRRPPASRTQLTKADAGTVIEHLENLGQPPTETDAPDPQLPEGGEPQ